MLPKLTFEHYLIVNAVYIWTHLNLVGHHCGSKIPSERSRRVSADRPTNCAGTVVGSISPSVIDDRLFSPCSCVSNVVIDSTAVVIKRRLEEMALEHGFGC
jgi:hypothetical protein